MAISMATVRAALLASVVGWIGAVVTAAYADPFLVPIPPPSGSAALPGADGIAVSPDGAHVYAAGTDDLVAFGRDTATGGITVLQTLTDGVAGVDGIGGRSRVLVSPDGAHVYVSGATDDAVAVFARDAGSGLLSFAGLVRDGVDGVDGLDEPTAIAMSPDGTQLYATARLDDAVAVFARDTGTGALTLVEVERDAVAGVSGMDSPLSLTVGPGGAQVYVVAGGVRIVHFDRDAGGSLTFREVPVNLSTIGMTTRGSIVVTPDPTRLLAAAHPVHTFLDLRRDTRSGRLTLAPEPPVQLVLWPKDIAVHPTGGVVYFSSEWNGRGTAQWRDPRTLRRNLLEYTPSLLENGVALSPDARHVYYTGNAGVGAFAAPCAPLVLKARLALRRTITDLVPNDDVLSFKARALVTPARAATLEPPVTGAHLTITTDAGAIVDVALPGGPFGGSGTAGWTANTAGTAWTFTDKTAAPANGIGSVKLQVKALSATSTEVRVVVKGQRGSYPYQPEDGPIDARLDLDPDHCFSTAFRQSVPVPCTVGPTSVNCRL